jgi:hypothetical protein
MVKKSPSSRCKDVLSVSSDEISMLDFGALQRKLADEVLELYEASAPMHSAALTYQSGAIEIEAKMKNLVHCSCEHESLVLICSSITGNEMERGVSRSTCRSSRSIRRDESNYEKSSTCIMKLEPNHEPNRHAWTSTKRGASIWIDSSASTSARSRSPVTTPDALSP